MTARQRNYDGMQPHEIISQLETENLRLKVTIRTLAQNIAELVDLCIHNTDKQKD